MSRIYCSMHSYLFFRWIFFPFFSGVQQSDSVIHIYMSYIHICSFLDFSIIGYYKILSIVLCAIQSVRVGYLFYPLVVFDKK